MCSCLSPRPDFGSKNIAEVITLRGFRMFRFKFCRASEERLFQAARRLKRQNVPADSICFNCFSIHREAKQQSVAEETKTTHRLSGLQFQASVKLLGRPAVLKLVQIHCIHVHMCCCRKPHAHSDTQKGRQGFTGDRGSSSSFEGQPSQS